MCTIRCTEGTLNGIYTGGCLGFFVLRSIIYVGLKKHTLVFIRVGLSMSCAHTDLAHGGGGVQSNVHNLLEHRNRG